MSRATQIIPRVPAWFLTDTALAERAFLAATTAFGLGRRHEKPFVCRMAEDQACFPAQVGYRARFQIYAKPV